jgi:hypothetical protein
MAAALKLVTSVQRPAVQATGEIIRGLFAIDACDAKTSPGRRAATSPHLHAR